MVYNHNLFCKEITFQAILNSFHFDVGLMKNATQCSRNLRKTRSSHIWVIESLHHWLMKIFGAKISWPWCCSCCRKIQALNHSNNNNFISYHFIIINHLHHGWLSDFDWCGPRSTDHERRLEQQHQTFGWDLQWNKKSVGASWRNRTRNWAHRQFVDSCGLYKYMNIFKR